VNFSKDTIKSAQKKIWKNEILEIKLFFLSSDKTFSRYINFLKKIIEKLKSIKIRNKILKRVFLNNDLENLSFTNIFAGFTEDLVEIKILSYFKQNLNEI
jgi:hypothetical protein